MMMRLSMTAVVTPKAPVVKVIKLDFFVIRGMMIKIRCLYCRDHLPVGSTLHRV